MTKFREALIQIITNGVMHKIRNEKESQKVSSSDNSFSLVYYESSGYNDNLIQRTYHLKFNVSAFRNEEQEEDILTKIENLTLNNIRTHLFELYVNGYTLLRSFKQNESDKVIFTMEISFIMAY